MTAQDLTLQIDELEKKVIILTQLAEISASLNSQVELEPLLQHIMEVATKITDCEAASVLLWDSKNNQLVFAASTTERKDSKLIGMPVPLDSIAGTIFQSNNIVQVDNTKQDPRHYDKVDADIQFVTRSLLGVPMTYNDKVIGVLEAINKKHLPWTEDDRSYLRILAAQAAVAIQGARLVMRLKRANEELQETDKLKNNFIAIASHELRTPLGVVMGYASFLQMEESQSAQDNANKVMDSALKLRKIIDDMVNLRYLKQKQSDLFLENTTVAALFAAFKREMMTVLEASKQTVEFSTPEYDIPVYVDSTRLVMALANMLNNAIAFTPPEGQVSISAKRDQKHVYIIMQDTGAGIEANLLEKIFEEFFQAEDHMTRKHGGLGIGLSIARAIVEAHNGTIKAASPGLNQGSTFTIQLPI
jgi:signal transduction histidine kinase